MTYGLLCFLYSQSGLDFMIFLLSGRITVVECCPPGPRGDMVNVLVNSQQLRSPQETFMRRGLLIFHHGVGQQGLLLH